MTFVPSSTAASLLLTPDFPSSLEPLFLYADYPRQAALRHSLLYLSEFALGRHCTFEPDIQTAQTSLERKYRV